MIKSRLCCMQPYEHFYHYYHTPKRLCSLKDFIHQSSNFVFDPNESIRLKFRSFKYKTLPNYSKN